MKASVYAVRLATGWEVRFTVDWDTDRAFWLDSAFRDGVAEGWEAGAAITACGMREPGSLIVKLKRSLPLGEAEAGCASVQAELGRKGGVRDAEEVERMLLSQFGELATPPDVHGEPFGELFPSSSVCERMLPGQISRAAGRALAGQLLPRVKALSARLAGRSLLQAEVAALLNEHEPGSSVDAMLPSILQLGALLGGLRLGAAVADAAPARGRRRLRCRRCGSGEAAMRRSACASCGSDACAVCEACLALGRSRACGLLVRGPAPAASRLGSAAGVTAQTAAADICGRWGLSPAQRAASEQAVRFLLAGEEPGAGSERERRSYGRPSLGRSSPGQSWLERFLPRRASLEQSMSGQSSPGQLSPGQSLPGRLPPLASLCSALGLRPSEDPLAIQPRSFLLWAVTGAGKTEMIFPLLDAVMSAGGRALLATPRRDVVLELAPRLNKAFPGRDIAVLYGGSGDRWRQAELTLATTHQLMRFEQAFDLVLIDELDAYPYHGDPMLHYAASAARKPGGSTVLLSATPPPMLRRAARWRRLPCAKVPVRYHRHPLPVPRLLRLPALRRWIAAATSERSETRGGLNGRLTAALLEHLGASLARGAQVFVFVPYIRHIEPLVAILRRQAEAWRIPASAIDGTSSQDDGRRDKVVAFRERQIRLLVTTTILERGVTVPRSDVFILDAHAGLFDEAALVQMAGRAGRSADDPDGRVFFCAEHRTRPQISAVRQVSAMNRLARRGGYLINGAPRAGSRSWPRFRKRSGLPSLSSTQARTQVRPSGGSRR